VQGALGATGGPDRDDITADLGLPARLRLLVGSPGVEAASPSRGDSGKAGVSGTAVAAGVAAVGAAAVGAAAAATAAKRSDEESQSGRESEISGDVVAVGPTGGTESTLHTSPTLEPSPGSAHGVGAAFDDDPALTDRLDGDPVAVDPATATGVGDDALDPRDPRSGTLDDPDNPRRPVL